MLIGWNGETMPALPLEREVEVIAQAGYRGLEVFIPKLGPYLQSHSPADLARLLAERHIEPLTMNGIENINLRPASEFQRVKDECRRVAEVAAQINCPAIVVVPSPKPEGMPWPEIRERTAAALAELAATAAPYGVRLAFEFLAPAACSVRTLEQGLEVVQAAGQPNLGLVFDTYHFHVGGSSLASLDALDVSSVLIVHINDVEGLPLPELTDGHRLLPGEGVLPLTRMLSPLVEHGYDGGCALEVMRPAYRERDPLEYAKAGFEAIRKTLALIGAA